VFVSEGAERRAGPLFLCLRSLAIALALALVACEPERGTPRPPTLLFVGDMMLGRDVEATMRQRDDWSHPFRPLGSRLRAADLTFGNLECVVAESGQPRTAYRFRADPRVLEGLRFAGFDVVSVANTHTTDWGPDALLEMLRQLTGHGIGFVGVDQGDVQSPVIVEAGALRVGLLAFSHYVGGEAARNDAVRIARIEGKQVIPAVEAARPDVDYLVVSLHGGEEFAPRATEAQRGIARAVIDAGADLVVGHHPHVPQEVEKYGRGFIAYSLGNFVFDHLAASREGALLEVTLAGGRPSRIAYVRIRINDTFQPEAVSEQRWEGPALEGPDRVLD
jgi:poly-gamma-glutamate capsule biosynthesis protein CapA/YwtB (metallophosphatase superfamily)